MMKRCKTVDEYIAQADQWQAELIQLRKILQATPLEETIKWGAPCYTFDGKNVVGIGAFKSYVGLWFHQGALLGDELGVLINAQDGKTKALRQWRFTNKKEIKTRSIKAYVAEAIELVQQGREIKAERGKPIDLPPELSTAFGGDIKTREAFESLTPGKQREYANYISEAKREATRLSRIDKIIPMIRAGKGLNDRYRNC